MLLIMIKSLHCLEVCLQEFNLAQPKLLLSSIVGCSDELLCLAVVLLLHNCQRALGCALLGITLGSDLGVVLSA